MTKILDWKKYTEVARRVVAEGCVLLENKDNVLPLKKGCKVAVFGRIQHNYYKSGTGSGGMVNVTEVTGITEGLKNSGLVKVDTELEKIYLEWEKEGFFDTLVFSKDDCAEYGFNVQEAKTLEKHKMTVKTFVICISITMFLTVSFFRSFTLFI